MSQFEDDSQFFIDALLDDGYAVAEAEQAVAHESYRLEKQQDPPNNGVGTDEWWASVLKEFD